MKLSSMALAWMLFGQISFGQTLPASDASALPSVMVQPRSMGPIAAEPAPLPEMSGAKPLPPPGDDAATVGNATEPQAGELKSVIKNRPSGTGNVRTPGIEPARYEEDLPPPSEAPSTNNPTAVDPTAQAAARAAADLLASSLGSTTSRSNGLSLQQVLARCPETERAVAAQAYWRLSRAGSNHEWALDEQKRLEQIVPSRGTVEGPMLSTARAAAAAHVTEAELETASAQAALARAMSSFELAGSDRPSDKPLVGLYHTYYSQIFAHRPHRQAWQIDHTLPIRLKAINDRAATVQSAVSAVHYAEEAHAKGETDLRTVLACHDDLRAGRREFLDAVLQYNLDIAEYAAAAAPVGTSPEKFASMLIPTSSKNSTTPANATKPPERMSAAPGKPAATNSVIGNSAIDTTRPPQSDGWVPSTLRNLDPVAPPAGAEAPRYNLEPPSTDDVSSSPTAQPLPSGTNDPFAEPAAIPRYNGP